MIKDLIYCEMYDLQIFLKLITISEASTWKCDKENLQILKKCISTNLTAKLGSTLPITSDYLVMLAPSIALIKFGDLPICCSGIPRKVFWHHIDN